jgi:hypothetical protein
MGYITEVNLTEFGCCGIIMFGADGQGVLYPGTWVAV